ncbi:MAG: metallophosphoesterase [Nitrospinae bacterium RIFCSPLOWO2_12_FULL_45_22]|nr:MAG: metallophosphoesterase [Nitrospinae bacterium RIFCSPLOWO2_12_FULL_45_22]
MPDKVERLRVLFVGDIVGRVGRRMIKENLPSIISEYQIDFCLANGENAAGGLGITPEIGQQLLATGIHVLTSGNHIWSKKEVMEYIAREHRLLRPANYPPEAPGSGSILTVTPGGTKIAVINLLGRIFIDYLDCPFKAVEREIARVKEETRVIIVDMHAEATSEKSAMGWYLDGRVSAMIGTHTHIQTADEKILPRGTAFISDAGMTGPAESVIGMERDMAIHGLISRIPKKVEPATGPGQLEAVIIDIDPLPGKALSIQRLQIKERKQD